MKSEICKKCADKSCFGYDHRITECEDFQPQTNYDRLISKSPEELAEYLAPCACPPIHFNKTGVIDCPVGKEPCESDCKNCWINWLKDEEQHDHD